jgi:hypothetical protein
VLVVAAVVVAAAVAAAAVAKAVAATAAEAVVIASWATSVLCWAVVIALFSCATNAVFCFLRTPPSVDSSPPSEVSCSSMPSRIRFSMARICASLVVFGGVGMPEWTTGSGWEERGMNSNVIFVMIVSLLPEQYVSM